MNRKTDICPKNLNRMTPIILLVGLMMFSGCVPPHKQDTLYQVSTLQALMDGMYDGQVSVAKLKHNGNLGIGTVNALDGELVMVDGGVWHIRSDGKAYALKDTDTTPFADVTRYAPDVTGDLPKGTNFDSLRSLLDTKLPNKNLPVAIRVDGTFSYVKTRSVPMQKKPYPPLTEVVKMQPVFEFHNVRGTLVGFRMPEYFKGINMAGYHLHFISADRSGGGHLLDFTADSARAGADDCTKVTINLPSSDDFAKANLGRDMSAEIHKVEK
jgi:acetolactate decarboxylase